MNFLLEIQQLLTFSVCGERRGRNAETATGFMLNQDAWKENIIYFGWSSLKKLDVVCAKLSHHSNLKHPRSVTYIPKGIPSIPCGRWDPTCPPGPELFWHALYPIKNHFSHLQLLRAAFHLTDSGTHTMEPQGRVVGSQRLQGCISTLLSQGGHRPPSPGYPDTSFWTLSSDTKACSHHPGLFGHGHPLGKQGQVGLDGLAGGPGESAGCPIRKEPSCVLHLSISQSADANLLSLLMGFVP